MLTGTLVISIIEKNCRETGKAKAMKRYGIYSVSSKDPKVLDAKFFGQRAPCAGSEFCSNRDLSGLHKLPPGDYCLVVYTQSSADNSEFLLRIYSENPLA